MRAIKSVSNFPADSFANEQILDMIFRKRFQSHMCPDGCGPVTEKYKAVKGRKCYQCTKCRRHLYPLKSTIFEGSTTELRIWLKAMIEVCKSKNGVSALELHNCVPQLTYKTAWRIHHKIRQLISQNLQNVRFTDGIVEIDESFFGGRKYLQYMNGVLINHPKKSGDGKGIGNKFVVFGMYQRGGRVKLFHLKEKNTKTIIPLIYKHISRSVTIHSDAYAVYNKLSRNGFAHKVIESKGSKTFKRGVHTNGIEGVWALAKNNFLATHKHISKKYLQEYLDEFAFRYKRDYVTCITELWNWACSPVA